MASLSGIVVAGGQSRRMGTDKGLVDFGGRPLVAWGVAALAELSDDVIVVTNTPEGYATLEARLVGDVYPGKGVLGGIYSGLLAARYPHSYVIACDMPFVNPRLLTAMAERAAECDAVVPWLGDGEVPDAAAAARAGALHPLHAVYSRACLPAIERALAVGDLRAVAFFADVRVCYFPTAEIDRIDPGHRSLMNINTPEELALARRLRGEAGECSS